MLKFKREEIYSEVGFSHLKNLSMLKYNGKQLELEAVLAT